MPSAAAIRAPHESPAGARGGTLARLARLTALYVSQGLPFGFATAYIPMLLATRPDFAYAKATLFSLANFPWMLKLLWAPLADTRYFDALGRRRSWILPAQAGLAATAAAATALDFDGPLLPLFVLTAALNLFASLQDSAVDGLAVELLPERERGPGNAAQVAGYKLGMVLGGAGLVAVAARAGARPAMALLALAVAALLLVPLLYREPPPPPRARELHKSGSGALRLLADILRRPGWPATLLFIATVKIGETAVGGLVRPYLVREAHLGLEQVAWLVGFAGMTASLAGSLAGGWICGRTGRLRALAVFGALQAAVLVALGLCAVAGADASVLGALVVAEHFATGLVTPALFAYMMDLTDPAIAGTQYALLATIELLSKGAMLAAAGPVADRMGVAPFFLLAGAAGALPLLLLPFVRRPLRGAADPG